MVTKKDIDEDIESLQQIKADLYDLNTSTFPLGGMKVDSLAKSIDKTVSFLMKKRGSIE